MKWKSPGFWIGTLSTAGILALALGEVGSTSPGAVARVHALDPTLEDGQNCAACHGGFLESMTDACLACHADVGEHIERGEGLHGTLGDDAPGCGRCHSDHHGEDFAMVNTRSFALADVPDPEAFDHARIGFAMGGKHLELDCAECHTHARVEVLPAGAQRFFGLDQDCATCHEDPHEGRMVPSCAQCHSQEAFDVPGSFGHEEVLPLGGGHAGVSCEACHDEDGAHSLEALGRGERPDARGCSDCHDSPHAADFLDALAGEQHTAPDDTCAGCHDVAVHPGFDGALETTSPLQHALTGFPLDAPHDEVGCLECHPGQHAGTELGFAERYPGRASDACRVCHDDPHGGQFDRRMGDVGCLACHAKTHFEPHLFTPELHALGDFPLEGRHLDASCESCHQRPHPDQPRTFLGTETRCDDCHSDAHAGFFEEAEDEPVAVARGSCALCHTTVAFDDVAPLGFDHGRWAGFEIEGAHAQSDCESCHPRAPAPDDLGRSFGRVSDHFGDFEGCHTCHTDPHRGAFDTPEHPAVVGGASDCARCHVPASFRAFPEGFDHLLWTGFPLDGAHLEAGCSACHQSQVADEFGRTWGPALGSDCSSCHANPHAGQFRSGGATDCRRCHSTRAFDDLVFDHDRDARFPLDDAHAALDCSACHVSWSGADGLAVVRYRPLGTQCIDCHGAHEDSAPVREDD